ncbi:MAG: hypothetical protein AAF438_22055, partial [Pseudomonadota bacterium]
MAISGSITTGITGAGTTEMAGTIAASMSLPGLGRLASHIGKFTPQGQTISHIFRNGRVPKASELQKWAKKQGWKPTQNGTGPVKYIDQNSVTRLTIKRGSTRAPNSDYPHIELRDSAGNRIDPRTGNPTTRRSPNNLTKIEFDTE